MKVLIARFIQESNSFSAIDSGMDSFSMGGIVEGADMTPFAENSSSELTGFVQALKEAGADIVPSISMRSLNSCGRVERAVYDFFITRLAAAIKQALPLDGVFLSFHGATQLTDDDDGMGLAAADIRALIGDGAVFSISTDYHANVTKKTLKYADYVCGYHTYPHIDLPETGYRAAKLGIMSISEGKRFPMAHIKLPLLLQAEASQTTVMPIKGLVDYAERLCADSGALDYSIYQMQPWLDVYEGGASVLVVARDGDIAESLCERIAQRYWDMRADIVYTLADMDEVLDIALKNKSGKPVIMSDSADSPSAGATGDSTVVLYRLLEHGIDIPAILTIADADVPLQAERLGVGNTGEFMIGGKVDTKFFKPVKIKAYVKAIHDGDFVISGDLQKGMRNLVGKTAVLQCGTITIVCYQQPCYNFDPQVYLAFGIDPALARLVVVKSATQYRAHYACYSDLMYTIDTPGAASANLHSFEFKHLPRPIHPFDDMAGYKIGRPTIARK